MTPATAHLVSGYLARLGQGATIDPGFTLLYEEEEERELFRFVCAHLFGYEFFLNCLLKYSSLTTLSALKSSFLFLDSILATDDLPEDNDPVIPIFIKVILTPVT